MDLRLYLNTGTYDSYPDVSELTSRSKADSYNATGIEVIANKVVKFLLTYKGTDALDPDYGGIALHYGQISESFMPRFSMEMQNDVQRCREFIRKTELSLPSTAEKMRNLILQDIKYNSKISPDRVDVYIEIITTSNNRALVALPNRT